MPLFLLKYGKWIALALVILGVVATAYFAVRSYNRTMEENARLQTEVAQERANVSALQRAQAIIKSTIDSNAQNTTRIVERTNTIREAVNALPTTTQCADSQPVRVVLDELRRDQNASTNGTNPVSE